MTAGGDDAERFATTIGRIPPDWAAMLGSTGSHESLAPIADFVARHQDTLPSPDRVFAALWATPFDSVRALILGQDPYPTRSQAMGLAFSVPRDLPPPLPRSLQNIRAELQTDGGWAVPDHGSLESWTREGVLLLNTTLTVQSGAPGSHRGAGWSVVTDAIVAAVAAKEEPVAFLLWGEHAKAQGRPIDSQRHVIVPSSHPSPRSKGGFLGSKPFTRANEGLVARGAPPINWNLDG